ncbi:MAG: cysteine desulfurase [SAR202 cluster bacterium]|nr:cysteine desulfurase [SAR202 cluster bacterium]
MKTSRRGEIYDVMKVREDFPVLARKVNGHQLVYLDNAATSQKPRQVIAALVDYYERYNANVHRGVHTLSIEATDAYEEARAKVQKFINAPVPESVIWTRNTSESINLVAYAYARKHLKAGDEIVTTVMEHHSDLISWQQICKELGTRLRFIPRTEEGLIDLSTIDEIISARTKLVAVTHMSNVLGTIVPVREIAERAHAVGAVILVDGAQSVPHMPVDVQDLDCDFLAFSGHKMLGPTGIGVLYGKPEILEDMQPFMYGSDMILEVSYEGAKWNQLPYKFEAGTPNIADAIATGAAVDYLENLGMDAVWRHEQQLTAYALRRFAELENYRVVGPTDPSLRGGTISFTHDQVHPHDLGTALDRLGIAIRTGHHCAMPLVKSYGHAAVARASMYIYNHEGEIDHLIEGLKQAEGYFSHAGSRRS